MQKIESIFRYLFDPARGSTNHFMARWLFLRALGLIYFSAFFSLLFQIRGLIGPQGLLPAGDYLDALRRAGAIRFWYAPTLVWLSYSDGMLMALCWVGLIASLVLVANVLPRVMLLVCFVCFLSFIAAAQDFSSYQSDGMLLEAGFISLFLAPAGLFPGLALTRPSPRFPMFLLLWEWFRIYFESGVAKLASGDPTWRNLTAMYEYYQNGPLPTWIGWYMQHLPHWFHIATAGATLVMELVLVWLAFLPRRYKILCFFIVTAWQIGVIASANYTFLNYLVLALAVFLLDDTSLRSFLARLRPRQKPAIDPNLPDAEPDLTGENNPPEKPHGPLSIATTISAIVLLWIFYATAVPLVFMFWQNAPLPTAPLVALDPFRIANKYGLFANMTLHRYEIEFQGSNDGEHWVAYPFRYKPQSLDARPRIYAPYQPRFDWNLWFASLGPWQENSFVVGTEERLLENDHAVLNLFAGNPFQAAPPRFVRSVLWQYWFSSLEQKRTQGLWWTRQLIGPYAPALTRLPNGGFTVAGQPALDSSPEP